MAASKAQRPTSVRVLGRVYNIVPCTDGDNFGVCNNITGVISALVEQDEFSYRDTILHETMHAILHQQGQRSSYKLEESFVRPLATGLITVLQDNPELAKWLIRQIGPRG